MRGWGWRARRGGSVADVFISALERDDTRDVRPDYFFCSFAQVSFNVMVRLKTGAFSECVFGSVKKYPSRRN